MNHTSPWPTELRLADAGHRLTVSFDDGARFDLTAEYLRVHSPSAEVQGHAPSQRQTQAGKRQVAITELQPTGNYAVRLVFDDGHASGIFTFAYLHELGAGHERKWADYLAELAAKGLSRDPSSR
jgi:DUF971 family protein